MTSRKRKHPAFEVIGSNDLSEYRSKGTHYRHIKSGCEIYHVENDDPENLFCFAFPTPPEDSTGVAHIMEHTVLCGSERFDIKDPFITLYRGSMNSYLNAGTGSDDTIFPAASLVEKDFFNLMMIYGDSVFFPLLKKEAFEQEGHHLEFDDMGKLNRVGIVYNEMRGDYASFDSIVSESSYTSLYTEGPLQYDAGGDPEHIPELSYEQFKDFHKSYYHPVNCRIFLYGNIPAEKTLDFLDENFLNRFDKKEIIIDFPLQKRWDKPIRKIVPGPSSEEETGCTHSINWLLEPVHKLKELTALRVLSAILLGHSGAPLQLAIEQSSLGDDLSPVSGLDLALYESLFSVGVRGAEQDKAEEFEELVFSTLKDIVKNGLSRELIEGTFRRQEFREREIRGGIPFGYRLMHKSIRGWLHGLKPADTMHFEDPINEIRKEALKEGFFENMIEKYLINNRHRSLVTVYPDSELLDRKEAEFRKELDEIQASLTADEETRIKEDNRKLREFQETPDDPTVIPCLHKNDIPTKIITIPSSHEETSSMTLFTHDFFTNGILYLDMLFPLSGLTNEEVLWLPFFTQVFFEMGVPGLDYQKASQELSLKLGGVSASIEAGRPLGSDTLISHMVIRVKMLRSQMAEAMDLVERFMRDVDFSDSRRLTELMAELKNDYRSSFVPSGTSYAVSHTVRAYSPATVLEEKWFGLEQYFHLNRFENSEENAAKLGRTFLTMKNKILQGNKTVVNITSDNREGEKLLARTKVLLKRLHGTAGGAPLNSLSEKGPVVDAFQISANVAYIGASLPGAMLGTREYCSQLMVTHLLKTGFLWEEVRMKGGAYGASASLSGLDGYFTFSSYRDPQIINTIETFRQGLISYPKTFTQEDLDRTLIGVIGRDLRPLAPLDKGIIAMRRKLYNITDELRQKNRDILLSLTLDELKKTALDLGERWDQFTLTVISGERLLDEASEEWGGLKSNRQTLL
jgi:Zn-dependent M16 (insulinase) family peptidase